MKKIRVTMGNLGDETESIRGRHISFVGSIAIREFVFFFLENEKLSENGKNIWSLSCKSYRICVGLGRFY
ncbi:hypothetical protein YC2023_032345 [Brassica napus]